MDHILNSITQKIFSLLKKEAVQETTGPVGTAKQKKFNNRSSIWLKDKQMDQIPLKGSLSFIQLPGEQEVDLEVFFLKNSIKSFLKKLFPPTPFFPPNFKMFLMWLFNPITPS